MVTSPAVRSALSALVVLGLGAALPASSFAQVDSGRTLVVGTKDAPPFAMKQDDGTWTGISIELWTEIANRLGYETEFQEESLPGLLEGVAAGTFDAGVAAVTVTPEREDVMDFTHPFHVSGLGIAVHTEDRRGWLAVFEQFLSFEFLRVVAGLSILLLVVGWLVWMFERRKNPDDFGGTPAQGIGSSFWWSAVTMTTVGYGDKSPRTIGGRVIALLWMFGALIVISSFTASITASLTLGSMEGAVDGPDDLQGVAVRSVADSTSETYLDGRRLTFTSSPTANEALLALERRSVAAVVYDAPILQYEVRQQFNATLTVLPARFERQLYAIALPTDSPLRESINRVLLEVTSSADWRLLLESYLGEPE